MTSVWEHGRKTSLCGRLRLLVSWDDRGAIFGTRLENGLDQFRSALHFLTSAAFG